MNHHGQGSNVRLWVALMQAQGTIAARASDRLEREAGIPLAWHDVLARLSFAPEGKMRMQELADALNLSRSGLTRLCDRIEQAGLIVRASCPSDRRGVHAVLTEEGSRKFNEAAPVFYAAVEEVLTAHLSEREQAAMRRALTKLIEANGGHMCWSLPVEEAV
jgi:DNA-binding MarR family transcriptional regulator